MRVHRLVELSHTRTNVQYPRSCRWTSKVRPICNRTSRKKELFKARAVLLINQQAKMVLQGARADFTILKLATWMSLLVALLPIQAATGFLTPGMIREMTSRGQPPLKRHIEGSVSTQCMTDLAELIIPPESSDILQVIDSIGKPEAGLLRGNLAWIGHYDECKSITDFNYCMTNLQVTVPSNGTVVGLPSVLKLMWGLCVPESCSDSDVLNSLQDFIDIVEAPFNVSMVEASSALCSKEPPVPLNSTGFIVTSALIGGIACLMVLGAFLDTTFRSVNYKPPPRSHHHQQHLSVNRSPKTPDAYPYQRMPDPVTEGDIQDVPRVVDREGEQNGAGEEEEEVPSPCARTWHQFVLAFAFNRNLAKLLSAKTSEGSIGCLNGIRVISMWWVILGHVTSFVQITGTVANPYFGGEFISHFAFQAISNAFFSVDTFFFLSGMLVAYMVLGRMAVAGGSLNWFWFYFHRYWRLTPALGMTMLISLYIQPYLGNGPIWPYINSYAVAHPCETDWWSNLLYINNFYREGCIGWVWYLANDMQFYIISPIFLIMLFRMPVLGMISLAVACCASFAATAVIMVKYNFQAVVMDSANPHQDPNHSFFQEIYVKPYCRITPYLVGMALGYFLHVRRNKSLKLHPVIVVVGWAMAIGLGMTIVYGLYGQYPVATMTTAQNAAYMTLSRFAWAICLSWVVVACKYGYGGWINDFLSWEFWIPTSRLTYSAYLLHPIIIYIFNFNGANSYYFSAYTLPVEYVGVLTSAYFAAVLLALFVEFPLGNLEKMIMPTPKNKAT